MSSANKGLRHGSPFRFCAVGFQSYKFWHCGGECEKSRAEAVSKLSAKSEGRKT